MTSRLKAIILHLSTFARADGLESHVTRNEGKNHKARRLILPLLIDPFVSTRSPLKLNYFLERANIFGPAGDRDSRSA